MLARSWCPSEASSSTSAASRRHCHRSLPASTQAGRFGRGGSTGVLLQKAFGNGRRVLFPGLRLIVARIRVLQRRQKLRGCQVTRDNRRYGSGDGGLSQPPTSDRTSAVSMAPRAKQLKTSEREQCQLSQFSCECQLSQFSWFSCELKSFFKMQDI